MNSFENPHNATPLTGSNDITAHSISLFQEMNHQNIKDIYIPRSDISVAEVMMFRLMNWEIVLLLCTSLLEILMTQKLVDWNHYEMV